MNTESRWNIPDVVLKPGVNIITVTAHSADGTESTDTLTIAHMPAASSVEWSIPNVVLQPGVNVITVRARDAAGNMADDIRTVTFDVDMEAPTIVIASPTAQVLTVAEGYITLKGTATDNVGVTSVTWTNDRGGSGTAIVA